MHAKCGELENLCILKACATIGVIEKKEKQIHYKIVKRGFSHEGKQIHYETMRRELLQSDIAFSHCSSGHVHLERSHFLAIQEHREQVQVQV